MKVYGNDCNLESTLRYALYSVYKIRFIILFSLSEQFPLFVTEGKIIKNIYYLLIN